MSQITDSHVRNLKTLLEQHMAACPERKTMLLELRLTTVQALIEAYERVSGPARALTIAMG